MHGGTVWLSALLHSFHQRRMVPKAELLQGWTSSSLSLQPQLYRRWGQPCNYPRLELSCGLWSSPEWKNKFLFTQCSFPNKWSCFVLFCWFCFGCSGTWNTLLKVCEADGSEKHLHSALEKNWQVYTQHWSFMAWMRHGQTPLNMDSVIPWVEPKCIISR